MVGGDGEPVLCTDATRHADWINGIITGTDVPPDDVIPNVEGAVDPGDDDRHRHPLYRLDLNLPDCALTKS